MSAVAIKERRGVGAYIIVTIDVLALVVVLGAVLYTLSASALRVLRPAAEEQRIFWGRLATQLCVPPSQVPALPPLAADAGVIGQLAFLSEMRNVSATIWRIYEGCQEPRTVVINEDLLHFKVDEYQVFEAPPGPAFRKICAYVDANLDSHNQIYVSGHTDDTYTEDYNFELSYKRALTVAKVIRDHLAARNLQPGRDYDLYPLGMGESQLLSARAGENKTAWRTRCRRIELSFRSSRGARPGVYKP